MDGLTLSAYCVVADVPHRLRPLPGPLQVQVGSEAGASAICPHLRLCVRDPRRGQGRQQGLQQVTLIVLQ